MPTPIAWTTAGAAILLRERSKAVTKPANTRDPVAALAASVDRFFNGDWEYAVRHGLAEQGYVLVNEPMLTAIITRIGVENPWLLERAMGAPNEGKVLAAAILAASREKER